MHAYLRRQPGRLVLTRGGHPAGTMHQYIPVSARSLRLFDRARHASVSASHPDPIVRAYVAEAPVFGLKVARETGYAAEPMHGKMPVVFKDRTRRVRRQMPPRHAYVPYRR